MAKVAATQETQQPLLYRNPVPLLADRHKNAGLASEIDYNFAKATNSVPINVAEFAQVCKYYPIAFTGDEFAVPVAIVGLQESKNLFVANTGKWRSGIYIPAYIRRYPFALSNPQEGSDKLILCVDEGSTRYATSAKKKDMKFFDDKKQSDLTKNALAFCAQYHKDAAITRQFSKTLVDNDLLASKQVSVKLDNGKTVSLGGFKTIDEAKLANLDPKLVVEWHKNGLLALLNFHLLSFTNWPALADLAAK